MTKEELIKLSRENLRKSKQGSLCECYDEAYIKGYELSEKQIAELEKENAELKNKLEHRNCLDCSNHSSKLRMRTLELEKENAELKEKYVKNITDCDICDTYCNSQLTKAKELLQFVSEYEDMTCYADELEEIKQFLKECK